ncbi:hypothetical protein JTB14_024445 [Gonioctena quinquepunctata]|nr:hypothetical protein JTB14_024445 [Gonioctena quinquepunctata]
MVDSVPRPRWNFGKAKWTTYAAELDMCIRFIQPKAKNYHKFIGLMIAVAKKHIPRGFRKKYIPGWSEEIQSLYEEFEDSGNPETADHLLRSLDASRMDKWTSAVERMNFARSSRKAWGLLRKLGECNRNVVGNASINPNQIANRIVDVSRAPSDKNHTRDVKKSPRDLKRSTPSSSEFSHDFSAEELEQGLKDTNIGKAAGFDGIYPEFLPPSWILDEKNCSVEY